MENKIRVPNHQAVFYGWVLWLGYPHDLRNLHVDGMNSIELIFQKESIWMLILIYSLQEYQYHN